MATTVGAGAAGRVRIYKVVHRADFERLLATPIRSRSAHFAVHYAATQANPQPEGKNAASESDLSTGTGEERPHVVDNAAVGYAAILPKRHARRAVTRNLLRRQIRSAFVAQGARIAPGQWLVRLRAPWPTTAFPSAASAALALASRAELDGLLARCAGDSRPARG